MPGALLQEPQLWTEHQMTDVVLEPHCCWANREARGLFLGAHPSRDERNLAVVLREDILFTIPAFHSPICGEWKETVSILPAKLRL